MAKHIYFLLQAPLPQAEQEISPTPIENQIQEMESLKDIIWVSECHGVEE